MEGEPGTADYPLLLNGTDYQLERFLMLGPFVTGKSAQQQQPKLQAVIDDLYRITGLQGAGPLTAVGLVSDAELRQILERRRVGQYTRICRALRELATSGLDYRTCKREDLIQIHGISMKSASFFLVYTQDADYAVWDTHLLRWAREHPWFPADIPDSTPPTRRYLELEQKFLEFCRINVRRPYEVDWDIWSSFRRLTKTPPSL
jgi:hypothetical protein